MLTLSSFRRSPPFRTTCEHSMTMLRASANYTRARSTTPTTLLRSVSLSSSMTLFKTQARLAQR